MLYYDIIQHVLHAKKILNPDLEGTMHFWDHILNVETKQKKTIDTSVLISFYQLIYCMHKRVFYESYCDSILDYGCKMNQRIIIKYQHLNIALTNIFFTKEMQKQFFEFFYKIQRTYFTLTRFFFKIKMKRLRPHIECDLYLNPIDTTANPNIVYIYQNNMKYIFTVSDILRLIHNALMHTETGHFTIEPVDIKNPYNNMVFNENTLYKLYADLNMRKYKIPLCFHAYVYANFDIDTYLDDNIYNLQHELIHYRAYNETTEQTIRDILTLIAKFTKLKIHKEFPRDTLVEIFRPYLELYYLGLYSYGKNKRIWAKDTLSYKLFLFEQYNFLFGRKIMNIYTRSFKFEEKHLPFH
jgi:hypothetical protein